MKDACILLSVCLLLLPCVAGAAPKPVPHTDTARIAGLPVTAQNGFVDVNAGESDVLSDDALTPFTAFLKAYPRAHSFGFSWHETSGMGGNGAAVQYDRVKHTVTVDYLWGGGDDPDYEGKVVFTGVRESVFAAILKARSKGVSLDDDALSNSHPSDAGNWGGFQYLYLHRYGCRAFTPKGGHTHRIY